MNFQQPDNPGGDRDRRQTRKAANTLNPSRLNSLTSPLDDRQLAQLQAVLADLSPLQLAWVSGYLAASSGLTVAANQAPGAERAPEPGPTLTILYGSQTGNARAVAESLAGLARGRGIEPRLVRDAGGKPQNRRVVKRFGHASAIARRRAAGDYCATPNRSSRYSGLTSGRTASGQGMVS